MIIYKPQDHLPESIESLVTEARVASQDAYAPYSRYKVGSAIRDTQGNIFKGSNQENASFPLCMCAERTTLYHYSSIIQKGEIESMAVYALSSVESPDLPPSPCGACRQVLAEFQSRQERTIDLILSNQNGYVWHFQSISELLPYAFDPKNLMI
ncbi:MAG: cytidine deaminase [Saprospiraceae bacterium]|nr:cytidine deaminase [Saprospiraceae bacterium]